MGRENHHPQTKKTNNQLSLSDSISLFPSLCGKIQKITSQGWTELINNPVSCMKWTHECENILVTVKRITDIRDCSHSSVSHILNIQPSVIVIFVKSLLYVKLAKQLSSYPVYFWIMILIILFNKSIMFTVTNPNGMKCKWKGLPIHLKPHKYNPQT